MKTHRSMTSSSADPSNGEKGRQEVGVCSPGLLLLAVQFLLKTLTANFSLIHGAAVELHSCLLSGACSPRRRNKSPLVSPVCGPQGSRQQRHAAHTGCLSSSSSTLSVSPSLLNLFLRLLLWPYADVVLCWTESRGCKTESSQLNAEC